MKILYKAVLMFFCTTGIAYAASTTERGATRTEACSSAKSTASYYGRVTSSCDCSYTKPSYDLDYENWVCAVDYEYKRKPSSNSSSYSPSYSNGLPSYSSSSSSWPSSDDGFEPITQDMFD